MKYYIVLSTQVKNLFSCFCIYLTSYILYIPLSSYLNKYQISNKYGKEFSLAFLISTLIFCIFFIFYRKQYVKKMTFSYIDLSIILLSFSFPVIITLGIIFFEHNSINYNFFKLDILYFFASFFIFALLEEVFFRFSMLGGKSMNTYQYFPIFTSSLLFSITHIANNSYSLVPFLVLFISGVILSLIYLKTNLLTATIAHAMWNISSSIIMGGNVSGYKVSYSLFTFENSHNSIINGGKFGIEGSLITLVLLSTICFILIFRKEYKKSADHIVP